MKNFKGIKNYTVNTNNTESVCLVQPQETEMSCTQISKWIILTTFAILIELRILCLKKCKITLSLTFSKFDTPES